MQRTERLQAAIDHARKSSRKLGHPHIRCSHLVLGLLTLEGGPARYTLMDAGVTPTKVEEFIASQKEELEKVTEVGGALFGKAALDMLARAEEHATLAQHQAVDAEHLLLVLLNQKKGDAADLFAQARVKTEKVAELIAVQLQ